MDTDSPTSDGAADQQADAKPSIGAMIVMTLLALSALVVGAAFARILFREILSWF